MFTQLTLRPLWSEIISISVLGGFYDITMTKEMEVTISVKAVVHCNINEC